MEIEIQRVDYQDAQQCRDLCQLLHEYASAETDSEGPMPEDHFDGLPDLLKQFPTSFSVLAYQGDRPVGLINSFFGFSTFALKRLVNVHDVMVTEDMRCKGVSGMMMAEVEKIAREHDCCRLTLEVFEDNHAARRAYEKHGFGRMSYHPGSDCLFLQKNLS